MDAKYIVFDGMDGSGKGTQIELLKEKFGSSVVFTREPGGTAFAEEIRKILLDNSLSSKSTAINHFLLFWAAREELQENLVVPALQEGRHVFSDRGDSSTFAFQLYGERHEELIEAFMFMRKLVFGAYKRRQPDLYVVFDLPAEVARERAIRDMGRSANHFDIRELGYYQRVRNGFMVFAKYAPVEFVDANQAPEEVHRHVWRILSKGMKITGKNPPRAEGDYFLVVTFKDNREPQKGWTRFRPTPEEPDLISFVTQRFLMFDKTAVVDHVEVKEHRNYRRGEKRSDVFFSSSKK